MDDDAPKETPPPDSDPKPASPREGDPGPASGPGGGPGAFNKIDLSQLQGFSFGTQWTQDKSSPSGPREREDHRSRRDRPGPGREAGPDRRDRRSFRRPDQPAGEPAGAEAREGAPSGAPGGRREPMGERGEPRRRFEGRDFRRGDRPAPHEPRVPYESPFFSVTFYPEDNSFSALVKTVRASCRTIELFEIARTVLAKPERFTVLLTRKDPSEPRARAVPGRMPTPAAAPAESAEGAPPAPSGPPKEPIFISGPDALPFDSEDAAIAHVLSKHLKLFFDLAEAEVEPPKGSFQVINRCGVTGELLGPPNYHRYNQIVQQHYAANSLRMPFEAYRSRIETVRDPEVVNQWLEKMKRVTRYTWKGHVPEGQAAPTFDSWEEARAYLLREAKDKVVRAAGHARFHGRELETLPAGEIRRAIEGALERQRRFPLDTANALRGRLRREHFTIFKKGAKGISYVCAVKRKFRTPGQTFAESIGALIGFIEAHPMVKAGELPKRFLGLAPEAPPGAAADPGAALANVLTVEQRERIARLQGDLLWLVREGYVTEFIDGSLYAPPPMVEARKKEVEREEVDPENFPERPAESAGAEAAGEAPAGEMGSGGEATPAEPEAPAAPAEAESPSPPAEAASPSAPAAGEPSPEPPAAASAEAEAAPAPPKAESET